MFRKKITPVYDRLMKRTYIPLDKTKCWEWTGPVNNAGYGMIKEDSSIDVKMVTVHRVSARHHGMDITKEINHTCMNKRCVNPDHLVYGNAKDRAGRIMEKYGSDWHIPEETYKECPHCHQKSYYTWFSRKHKHCYPGMMNKYSKYLRNKV